MRANSTMQYHAKGIQLGIAHDVAIYHALKAFAFVYKLYVVVYNSFLK